MQNIKQNLPTLTLLLMISFASVNAVLYTPALPNIAHYFNITENEAQLTVTWYLIAYAFGQLVYGPFANRFGRKPTLLAGISLAILSSFICILAGYVDNFFLLVLGRALLALGAGVGLKMAFTLVNECYPPEIAAQKISYLILAFAITPGLGVATGGILNSYFGWISCFYASAIYALFLFILSLKLPETLQKADKDALKINRLFKDYVRPFTTPRLIAGGLLMGGLTCFVYLFAAVAPFIAIDIHGMTSAEYGIANLIPPIGMISGSLVGAQLIKKINMSTLIMTGISISLVGSLMMLFGMFYSVQIITTLFLPMVLIYFGACFVMPNASTIAMNSVADKSHGSAVMNFINMGSATILVLGIGRFSISTTLLPLTYIAICIVMFLIYKLVNFSPQENLA